MSPEARRISLAEALADPAMLSRLSSAQVADLRFQAYEVTNALATAYIQAQQRERLEQEHPEWSLHLMDAAQVAKALGIKKAMVYEMMASGSLPFVQLGKYRRVRQGDVTRMLSRMAGQAERLDQVPIPTKLVRMARRA